MKIKTVVSSSPDDFDNQVNQLLEEGYMLGARDLVQTPAGTKDYFHAQLVLLDPVPEPEQPDPLEALRNIRDFCEAVPTEKCLTPDCPLSPWCHNYTEDGISPSDWLVPGEEAEV